MSEKSTPEEIWRDIPKYEGVYQVSNLGRVRSLDRVVTRVEATKTVNQFVAGQIIKTMRTGRKREYRRASLNHLGMSVYVLVHTLVAEAFISPCPAEHEVHHMDHNGLNNIVENLEYIHCSDHRKLHSTGEVNPNSRLTTEQVSEIRLSLIAGNEKVGDLAKRFGVSPGNIRHIKMGRAWRETENTHEQV